MTRPSVLRFGMLAGLGVALGTGMHSASPVLADAPAGHYVVANGTVYDAKTKLTWQLVVPTSSFALADAKAYCASSAVQAALGGSGWRLPTIKELYTLVDLSQPASPKIDPTFVPTMSGTTFWSSTPYASAPTTRAYSVGFNKGIIPHPDDAPPNAYARCVR